MMTVRLFILVLMTLLGACVAPPQPFSPDYVEALAQIPGIQSVRIELDGFAQTTALEYALTGALGAHDLPAYIGNEAPKGSYILHIAPAGTKATARLTDSTGMPLGEFETDLDGAAGSRALAQPADQLARHIAEKLMPTDPSLVSVPDARVSVLQGQGAPGDGDEALVEAMNRALRGRVPLDDAPSTENYVVTARVAVKRQGAFDSIALIWLILDAKGREAARMSQANQVPAGSLDKNWGKVAEQAANAAAEALIPVLRQLPVVPPR